MTMSSNTSRQALGRWRMHDQSKAVQYWLVYLQKWLGFTAHLKENPGYSFKHQGDKGAY